MSYSYMNNIKLLLAAGISSALLAGCDGDMQDLDNYILDVHARPAEPIPPIPPVKTYTPYEYEGQTGRDPFRASTSQGSDDTGATANTGGPRPDNERTREYLEQFELDTLSMVGTFAMSGENWGLIRDPDGVVHRVAAGNFMGRNHGRVVAIQEIQIDLTELITDGLGGWLVREASMAVEE